MGYNRADVVGHKFYPSWREKFDEVKPAQRSSITLGANQDDPRELFIDHQEVGEELGFGDQLLQAWKATRPSRKTRGARFNSLRKLETLIERETKSSAIEEEMLKAEARAQGKEDKVRSPRYVIGLHGSIILDLDDDESGVDVVIMDRLMYDGGVPSERSDDHFRALRNLEDVGSAIKGRRDFEIIKVGRGALHVVDHENGIRLRISLNDMHAMYSTLYLRQYALLSPLVFLPLCFLLRWLNHARRTPSAETLFKNYPLHLLVLFFLQTNEEKTLPVLHEEEFRARGPIQWVERAKFRHPEVNAPLGDQWEGEVSFCQPLPPGMSLWDKVEGLRRAKEEKEGRRLERLEKEARRRNKTVLPGGPILRTRCRAMADFSDSDDIDQSDTIDSNDNEYDSEMEEVVQVRSLAFTADRRRAPSPIDLGEVEEDTKDADDVEDFFEQMEREQSIPRIPAALKGKGRQIYPSPQPETGASTVFKSEGPAAVNPPSPARSATHPHCTSAESDPPPPVARHARPRSRHSSSATARAVSPPLPETVPDLVNPGERLEGELYALLDFVSDFDPDEESVRVQLARESTREEWLDVRWKGMRGMRSRDGALDELLVIEDAIQPGWNVSTSSVEDMRVFGQICSEVLDAMMELQAKPLRQIIRGPDRPLPPPVLPFPQPAVQPLPRAAPTGSVPNPIKQSRNSQSHARQPQAQTLSRPPIELIQRDAPLHRPASTQQEVRSIRPFPQVRSRQLQGAPTTLTFQRGSAPAPSNVLARDEPAPEIIEPRAPPHNAYVALLREEGQACRAPASHIDMPRPSTARPRPVAMDMDMDVDAEEGPTPTTPRATSPIQSTLPPLRDESPPAPPPPAPVAKKRRFVAADQAPRGLARPGRPL